MPRLTAAAQRVAPVTPAASISQNPVTAVPRTAPRMFAPYRRPTVPPVAATSVTVARTSRGSVAPMRNVGTSSSTNAPRKRTGVAAVPSERYAPRTAPTSHGNANAYRPISPSATA
jgi:hypothetical protein